MPRATDKETFRITLNHAERLELEHHAREAKMNPHDYARTKLGFMVRGQARSKEEREREEDDAWERLQRIGMDPAKYFPEG